MANLAPSWKPKRLQNRGPNPKKSMSKSNTYSASVFSWLGLRFGRFFGRYFEPNMDAKKNLKKSAREPFCIGKTNTKSMSALLQQRDFQANTN